MRQIILASVSPRRRQLMEILGLPFKATASNYREVRHKHLTPQQLAVFLAEGKARAAAGKHRKAVIIGADTVVVSGGKIYGKPKSKEEAQRMLKALSGKVHKVLTGVMVLDAQSGKSISRVVESKIHFRELSARGIAQYVSDGEPMDKAGAYAVQGLGAGLIAKVEGDFTNVVGLPLDILKNMLKKFGL